LQAIAQNSEEALAALLNVNLGGRYLFSGSQLDVPPVDLTDPLYTPQVSPSAANTSYYQGDNMTQNVTVADGYTLDYGVTADDIGFERLLRSMNLAANNSTDALAIQESLDLLNQAVDDIALQRTDVSSKATLIEARIQTNNDETALLQDIISSLEDTDLAEASVLLTQYQTQFCGREKIFAKPFKDLIFKKFQSLHKMILIVFYKMKALFVTVGKLRRQSITRKRSFL